MVKYYTMAIKKSNYDAMIELAMYYKKKNDIENAIKCYQMGIEHKVKNAIIDLAEFYSEINDSENTVKYYTIAFEQGNQDAIFELANYYNRANDQDNAVKCYTMAIEKDVDNAIENLAEYYRNRKDHENLVYLFHKYGTMDELVKVLKIYLCQGEEKNNLESYLFRDSDSDSDSDSDNESDDDTVNVPKQNDGAKTESVEKEIPIQMLEIISDLDLSKMKNVPLYLKLLVKTIKSKIDLLQVHYNYIFNGDGFSEAKNEYLSNFVKYNKS